MLSMQCLVRASDVGYIGHRRDSQPHLHVMRMGQRTLSANCINHRSSHDDLGGSNYALARCTAIHQPPGSGPYCPAADGCTNRGGSDAFEMKRASVDESDLWVRPSKLGRSAQTAGSENVVRIESDHEFPAHHFESSIERRHRTNVGRIIEDIDSLIDC